MFAPRIPPREMGTNEVGRAYVAKRAGERARHFDGFLRRAAQKDPSEEALTKVMVLRVCLRCGARYAVATATSPVLLCEGCLPREAARTDCARCGGPKGGRGRKVRRRLFCPPCAVAHNREVYLLRWREQRNRFSTELSERDSANAPTEVAEDPLGTYHMVERLRKARNE